MARKSNKLHKTLLRFWTSNPIVNQTMKRLIVVLCILLTGIASAQIMPRGTEIKLVLLKDLNSGGSMVGEEVPFMVARDIVVGNRVVVPEGTLVAGTVKQARREGALSAIMWDKPARLAVEFGIIEDIDGNRVVLKTKLNGSQQHLYQFNRDNTKIPKRDDETEGIYRTSDGLKVSQILMDTVRGARSIGDLQDGVETALVMEVARKLKLYNVVDLLRHKKFLDVVLFAAKLSTPGLQTLLGAQAALGAAKTTYRAYKEISYVATHFPNFLSRKFGGRNINAPMGVELSVFVG